MSNPLQKKFPQIYGRVGAQRRKALDVQRTAEDYVKRATQAAEKAQMAIADLVELVDGADVQAVDMTELRDLAERLLEGIDRAEGLMVQS